jgi:phage shock protein PspC (stress-responsive transcriptional regulator)
MAQTPGPAAGQGTQQPPGSDRVYTENLHHLDRLRRSVDDRKIAGVAGGIGRHLNIDPTVVRVVLVVLCFFGGAGFLLYGAAWLLVPEEGQDHAVVSIGGPTRSALLIVAGVVAALMLIGDSWGGFGFPWPLAVLALVVFLVLMNREKSMNAQTRPPGGSGPSDPSNPAGPDTPAAPGGSTTAAPTRGAAHPDEPATDAPDTSGAETTAPDPEATAALPSTWATGPDWSDTAPPAWAPPAPVGYTPPPPKPDRGPRLFWITVALVSVALGVLGLVDVGGVAVADAAYPALALAVIGGMLVLGAWVGRAGGLIFLGVVAAIALAVTSTVEPRFGGDRDLRERPATAALVADTYSVPAGRIELDLTEVEDLDSLDGRTISLDANAGQLVVVLPDGVDADVHADIAVAGEVQVGSRNQAGTGVTLDTVLDGGPDAAVPQIDLDLELLVGSIEVRQS